MSDTDSSGTERKCARDECALTAHPDADYCSEVCQQVDKTTTGTEQGESDE